MTTLLSYVEPIDLRVGDQLLNDDDSVIGRITEVLIGLDGVMLKVDGNYNLGYPFFAAHDEHFSIVRA